MANDQVNNSVISRIRKLMALTAARGATEAEAALATEHVQRLLAEYNLSAAHIEASGGSSDLDGKRSKEGVARKQVYKWQRDLMQSIAKLNYCWCEQRWERRGKQSIFDGYDLIGRVVNVASTVAMFDYLLQTIERLAREEVADPALYFTRYAHSYKEGCSDRLVERLTIKREAMVEEGNRQRREREASARHPSAATGSTALVLADIILNEDDLNNDHRHGWEPGTTARERAERDARYIKANADREAKQVALVAQGVSPEVAYFLACGYDRTAAERLANPERETIKPETKAQRARRKAKEERADDRYWDRERARSDREAKRLDQGAYRKGKKAGDGVGLDPQVKSDPQGRLG